MTEQLWAIGGVVAGIVATGGTNALLERVKVRQTAAETRRAANRERCEKFLTDIETEERVVNGFIEQHGVVPGAMGHAEATANARPRLTELELHCPPELYEAAKYLTDLFEGWAFGNKHPDEYLQARKEFVRVFRQHL